ncbi:hypothetical protein BGX21_006562 [Mortierella sp. AD011]|nr:hypothetical protein BGX20_007604 [Mortierella sp. AD010]KAF9399256.1 hypothetical protein BGX21_006562 [Mortierella sp. AD011]
MDSFKKAKKLRDEDADQLCISLPPTSKPRTIDIAASLPEFIFAEDKYPPTIETILKNEKGYTLDTNLILAFGRDQLKGSKAVAEVVCLASFLSKEDFRFLLGLFVDEIEKSTLLDVCSLEGLAQVMRSAGEGYLNPDDLVKILKALNRCLQDTHGQAQNSIYQLILVVSHVLDAMADCKVEGLDRVSLHDCLSSYVERLQGNTDPHIVYQAVYAFQALLCIPDNEKSWQATMRRTGKVMHGVFGLVTALKGLDLNGFIEGLRHIQDGLDGAFQAFDAVKDAYKDVKELGKSGQALLGSFKEGLNFHRKRSWYTAPRGIDRVLQDGQLTKFRTIVCEAPCRRNLAFQWKVCQRVGDLAANPAWDTESREDALEFLAEIYRNDLPDVEEGLRKLRKRRLKERGNAVYIPPRAKANLQAPGGENSLFDLTERIQSFLDSNQKVMPLLGDSGSGKSTFNRELECERPEQDLITKQLRKYEFAESQIRELKAHRKFILICGEYDESQQIHNLYTSNNLNQVGEWQAQMVVSCRSEYIGLDYRDYFQLSNSGQQSELPELQEAVIAPLSRVQVKNHIESLQELVKNPFLLALFLEVLPRLMDPRYNLEASRVTRVALYDEFMALWLERGKRRLGNRDMSHEERQAFEILLDEGFVEHGIAFRKDLGTAVYDNQGGNPVVEYSHFKNQGTWKKDFFSRGYEKRLLREVCPLTRSGNQFRFIHRSLLDYGMTRCVWASEEQVPKWNTRTESSCDTSKKRGYNFQF